MSHAPSAAGEHKPHILPLKIYAGVWIGLLVLTVITVKVSYYNFGVLNLLVAMGVATIKASLVVLFFMHLKYDEKFNAIIFVGCLTCLSIFFVLTLADTVERGRVDPIEARELVPVPARPELDQRVEGGHGAPAGGAAGVADTLGTHEGAPADSAATPAPGSPGGH